MMNPEALAKKLDREPFIPLKLNLTDGTSLDIFNPGLVFINNLAVYVATDQRQSSRLIRGDMRLISLRHIVSVNQLDGRQRSAKINQSPD
jgi:hypothetical protein